MKTVESTIPVDFLLPDNLNGQLHDVSLTPDIERLRDKDQLFETMEDLHKLLGNTWGPEYDEHCLSLEKEIEVRRINCLGRTALATLVGRVAGLELIPTIEVKKHQGEDSPLHAFSTLMDQNGDVYRSDYLLYSKTIKYGAPSFPSDILNIEMKVIKERKHILNHDGVVQVRSNADGKLDTLYDEETRPPHTGQYRYTFFPGDEGFKSYLNTIEHISAKANQRPPSDRWAGQLRPRI